MAAYTQASFTDSWYAKEAVPGLKTVEHIGETETSDRRPGGFPLCLFSMAGNETKCSTPQQSSGMVQGLWPSPGMWEKP